MSFGIPLRNVSQNCKLLSKVDFKNATKCLWRGFNHPAVQQQNAATSPSTITDSKHVVAPSTSYVTTTTEQFQINLDVKNYQPNEVTVKTQNNTITVEGVHEEKKNDKYTSSRFLRRYELSEGYDFRNIKSQMTKEGTLKIIIPKINIVDPPKEERIIPIVEDSLSPQIN